MENFKFQKPKFREYSKFNMQATRMGEFRWMVASKCDGYTRMEEKKEPLKTNRQVLSATFDHRAGRPVPRQAGCPKLQP